MTRDQIDRLALSLLPGLGCRAVNAILNHVDSLSPLFNGEAKVLPFPQLSQKQQEVLRNKNLLLVARTKAQQEAENLDALGIGVLFRNTPDYPSLLQSIYDPPPVLYYKGELSYLHTPALAIVGSRAATSYGKRIAHDFARDLARQGMTIVSGMAHGIDGQAHKGALESGKTIGVLGCGLDVVYPKKHAGLYDDVVASGLLLSEYLPGIRPDGFRFPARNRIIAGLSIATVVVEATTKSGSLITARLALDQGREIFAVPGRVDSPKSAGCHQLIQDGAHLALSAQSIIDELQLTGGMKTETGQNTSEKTRAVPCDIGDEELHLLSHLDVYPVTIDELVLASGISPSRIHPLLLNLELQGRIRQLPGQQYEKIQ